MEINPYESTLAGDERRASFPRSVWRLYLALHLFVLVCSAICIANGGVSLPLAVGESIRFVAIMGVILIPVSFVLCIALLTIACWRGREWVLGAFICFLLWGAHVFVIFPAIQ
jgi:hypothetical protein